MATTLSLTIGGVDFLPQYKSGSAQITNQIQNQGDWLLLTIIQKKGQSAPSIGSEIILKDGSEFLFGGFVSKLSPTEYGVGEMIQYTVEATDYTYLLVNKTAQKSYANETLHDIVIDLLSTNVDSGYALDTTNIETGPTVTTIAFNHISLRQCFENLAKLTGYIWWVGYDKKVYFINPSLAANVAEMMTDSSANHESVAITIDVSQLRNDIVVLGGVQESSNYTQTILGDAHAREFFLLYPPKETVSLTLNGVSKTFGIDPSDDETLFDYMYSPDRGSIRSSSGSTTLTGTDVLVFVYTYEFPVIVELNNATSIAAMKVIEGGDGVHSYTINDSTILSQTQARERAQKELDEFSDPVLSGNIKTRTGLLQAGTVFAAGMAIIINMPSWGIVTNTTYIIQKLVTTLDESGDAIEYHYNITFGGRLLGVVDFLQALATPEDPLDISGEVITIHAIDESISVIETISKNAHLHSVSETVSIAETINQSKTTPPFKWAPSGTKKGVWNESEWG